MKLTVPRKELYEGLQLVSRAVSQHTSLPVLKNIKIEPGTDSIKLTATDLDLGTECLVEAEVQEDGAITAPARTFVEIVGQLPEADVTIAADDRQNVIITCLRSEYRIHGLPAEDFPPLPEVGGDVSVTLSQPLLAEMIRQTALCASDDDTRPILTGVCLMVEEGRMRLVATDTHRLAVRLAKVSESTGTTTVIVPVRAMNEVARLLGDDPESSITLRMDENQIQFRAGGQMLVSRLIEGQFPSYERVIPDSSSRKLTIQREDFAAAVRRLRIVAREAAARDRIVLQTEGETVVLTAEAGDVGRAREELEVVREGDDISVAFNANYLLDAISVFDSEGIYLELSEPLSPAVVRPVDGVGDEDQCLMVVMPMQIQ